MFEPDFRLLIIIGYSFSDGHINDIIVQSLKQNPSRNLLIVSPFSQSINNEEIKREGIADLLALNKKEAEQLKFINAGAKEFLSSKLNIETMKEYINFDKDDNPFIE